MPGWYHCGARGCEFEDWYYHEHQCPEIINGRRLSEIQVSVPVQTVKKMAPRSDIRDSESIDDQVTQKTPATVQSGPTNVLPVRLQDAPAREYIIQYGNQEENEVVATLTMTCDKKGRLLIVFPNRKQEPYFGKQTLINCLTAFKKETETLHLDKNGFIIILHGISKSDDLGLLTNVSNDVLKDQLKQILVVPTRTLNNIQDPKTTIQSKQETQQDWTETSMSDDADLDMPAVAPIFIPLKCLLDYIAVDQLSPALGGTYKSRYISKPIYEESSNKRKLWVLISH